MARRTFALACLLALGFALMPSRAVVAAAGMILPEQPHRCVCPIGVDGECECLDCIRLDVHGTGGDAQDEGPRGPAWTNPCDTGGGALGAPLLDPAVTPKPAPRLPGARTARLGSPELDAPPLAPDLHGPEPPPRG